MKILKTLNLYKTFKLKNFEIPAVEDLNLEIDRLDFFALVGESGSGKSTIARLLLRLIIPDRGKIFFMNKDIWQIPEEELKFFRRSVQVVFQDPYTSLNPRMKIYSIIEEPLKIHKVFPLEETKERIIEMIKRVGLNEKTLFLYPHQLSGGMRQRVAIARALILNPSILIADEPLSSLDVSLQASLLELLTEMRQNSKLGILFITHDLNIVRTASNRVAVMHLGRIVEEGETEKIFKEPMHPYTKTLVNSIPGFHRRERKKTLKFISEETIPWSFKGCRFYQKCLYKMPICKDNPPLKIIDSRKVRCFLF